MSCGYGPGNKGAFDDEHADCSEVLHRIYEYLDGEMTEGDTHKIAEHLHECGPCLKQYDLDQALKALVKRSCAVRGGARGAAHADHGPDHDDPPRSLRVASATLTS